MFLQAFFGKAVLERITGILFSLSIGLGVALKQSVLNIGSDLWSYDKHG